MKKTMFALLAFAAIAGAAQAQGQGTRAPRAYAGAGVIWYDNAFEIPQASNVDRDEWKASGKLFGGIEIDQVWGVEAGWSHFREASAEFTRNGIRQGVDTDGYGVYLAGKASASLNPQFSVYGKLGIAYTKAEVSCPDPAVRGADDDDTGVYVGVGLEYKFHPEWSAVAEYERYGKEKDFGAKPDVLTIAAKYSF